jgi:ferredoxin-NADP reductase
MKKEKPLNLRVKGNIRDLLAFKNLLTKRKKIIEHASRIPVQTDNMKSLTESLHPIKQNLIIREVVELTKSSKLFKFNPDGNSGTKALAFFRAGQYLTFKVDVNGFSITRPYSISSSPSDALKGFYEIAIRKEEHGFLTSYIWDHWDVGTKVETSGPEGFFYFNPLRDSKNILGIAGGSGITPFRSIAKSILDGTEEANLTLLYGSAEEDDIMFHDELKRIEKVVPTKFKMIPILSCEEVTLAGCEQGFITADIMKKYSDLNDCSFFICGPQVMYDFIDKEINKLNIPLKRIRKEAYGEVKNVPSSPGFPNEMMDKLFKLEIRMGNLVKEIPAKATESVLVAMERAGLCPPSKCRSGECGYCRSKLIAGSIYINPIKDKRRMADVEFNYFHPCSSYPITNLVIDVPRSIQ